MKVNKQVNICSLDRVASATVDGPVSSLTKCNNAGLERLSRAANVRHGRHGIAFRCMQGDRGYSTDMLRGREETSP